MSTFIQLPLDARDPASAQQQRRRFHDYVTATAERDRDRVILVEPNPNLVAQLRAQWVDWPRVEIVNAAAVMNEGDKITFFRAVEDAPDFAWMGPDERALRRRFPNGQIEQVEVPAQGLSDLLTEAASGSDIALVAIDAGTPSLEAVVSLPVLHQVNSIVITLNDVTTGNDVDVRGLRARGFSRAGRAWGEAGESILLTRASTAAERLDGALAETRSRLGQLIVTARDHWVGPAQRQAAATHVRSRLRRDLSASDVLDPAAGHALAPVTRARVEEALRVAASSPVSTWEVPTPLSNDPMVLSRECHERHGVWPLSFSYPGTPLPINDDPEFLVSPITPGLPYSFTDEAEYLATYTNAYWGLTHRKAGWDCFRHLEIMASGAVPWMLDADEIPRYSMVHYPKVAMATAARALRGGGRRPDQATRHAFHRHLETHLTSRAMARYMLDAAGLMDARSVLFVDERLPHHADYLSVLTLIGLKQLLGRECGVMFPVDYIYDDTLVDVSTLYGRGFGYTRVVPGSARGDNENMGAGAVDTAIDGVDAVIVGSVTRNGDSANCLLELFPADRTLWIHGEDLPPTVDEVARYRRSKVHMFVRSIHVSR